jgi:hypothetical protein
MMDSIVDSPFFVFVFSFVALLLSAEAGLFLGTKLRPIKTDEREDLSVVLTATLTLLGLLVGFTFSMAVSRYDQRKNYEEEEANAIGTEYKRTDLLPTAEGARTRELLKTYLDQRMRFYKARDERELLQINTSTTQLQSELWFEVASCAAKNPSPTTTLAVAGMNDVLNTQGYTQAAWWNRLPLMAWGLMSAIGIFCNFLFGFGSHRPRFLLFILLPLAVSISFFLIADIDSPRKGLIRVLPQNLLSLSASFNSA